ncbi:MAG TPA: transglycosylase SLT domain-containing protein [Polyangiaceae bacterium]|nr:transglycosylase SLT domain-containing protein [Polyangiaceae bacterium]
MATPRELTTLARARALALILFAASCPPGLLGCSAPQQVDGSSGGSIRTPLDVAPSTTAGPAQPPSSKVLDLENWHPILEQPEFAAVARALEEDQPERAAQSFVSALAEQRRRRAAQSTAQAEDPALLLLQGRLQERASNLAAAIASYQEAAASEWVLADYARYCAGHALLLTQKSQAALASFAAIRAPLAVPLELERAEAQFAVADRSAAIHSLRQYLGASEAPAAWVRASLLLARSLLNELPKAHGTEVTLDDRIEALHLVRRVETQAAGTPPAAEAVELENRILGSLPPEEFKRQRQLSSEDQLLRLGALVDARRFVDAGVAAAELEASLGSAESESTRCEALLLSSKALAGQRKWQEATERLQSSLANCHELDFRARALFLAGRYALSVEHYSDAARLFAQLEKEAPEHRLADDARVKGAYAYQELGDEGRYTSLLGALAMDYPNGDVTLEGVLDLALNRIAKNDWSGAANVLERAMPQALEADKTRDQESLGRERYFRARAWIATGEKERGLAELAQLIQDHPLSYYMQLAYSWLVSLDPGRAETALAKVSSSTEQQPFAFRWRPEFETPGFQRALQLMRLSEVDWAALELAKLAPTGDTLDPDLSWALALLYERAGSPNLAQKLVQGKLNDWLSRWPVGDWRKAWEIAFPRPHSAIVQREAKRNALDEALIYGVMREESVFDPRAISAADAYGLMQLVKPTAEQFARKLKMRISVSELLRPDTNIRLGSRVLHDYQAQFPDNPLLAIPAYNAGPGRPRRWIEQYPNVDFDVWVELIPFRETRRYTKRVLASRGVYAFLYSDLGPSTLSLPVAKSPRG